MGLFCRRALEKRLYSAKETCNLIDPTNRCHPIRNAAYHKCAYIYVNICACIYICVHLWLAEAFLLLVCLFGEGGWGGGSVCENDSPCVEWAINLPPALVYEYMYIYICVNIHVYMYVCVCGCMCVYINISIYIYTHVYIHIYIHMYYIYICVCVCVYVHMCVCVMTATA